MNMQWPDTSMYGFRLGVMEWLRENDEPRYRMFVYPAMEDRPISPVFEERFARLGFTRNESNGVWSIDPGAVTRGAIAEAFPRTVVRAYDRSQIVFTVGSVQPSAPVTEAQPSPSPPAGDVSDERTAEDDTDSRAAGD